jgi:hypothetical protein
VAIIFGNPIVVNPQNDMPDLFREIPMARLFGMGFNCTSDSDPMAIPN